MDHVADRALIARLNIEHYKQLLVTEADEFRREVALRRLAEEQGVLAEIVRDTTLAQVDVALAWDKSQSTAPGIDGSAAG